VTRIWEPAARQWRETAFPVRLVNTDDPAHPVDEGVRFGVLRPSGELVELRVDALTGAVVKQDDD
jgi:hypothetical protein